MGHPYPNEDFTYLLTDKGDLFLRHLFDRYYGELCKLSFKYVGRADVAEDLVQDVFINLWNKRNTLQYTGNIKPCLITSVINTSINYTKSKFARRLLVEDTTAHYKSDNYNQHDQLVSDELNDLVRMAIEQLPDRCRIIFTLNRYSGLSYKEIAHQLSISVKTVEAQMTIALKRMQQFLARFGYLVAFFLPFH